MSSSALTPLMALKEVTRTFGSFTAIDGISFDIHRGEVLGIAGPNGAGKTTTLNLCTGVLPVSSGQISFEGQQVDKLPAHRCCHLGIARTFQIPKIFSSMNTWKNVYTGSRFGRPGIERTKYDAHVSEVIDLVELSESKLMPVSDSDLLTRKRIMLGAALCSRPKILFLDEPLAGLNADEMDTFIDIFRRIHASLDVALVIVEHKIRALELLSDRILILNFGSVLTIDEPSVVMSDPEVIEIYLGKGNLA